MRAVAALSLSPHRTLPPHSPAHKRRPPQIVVDAGNGSGGFFADKVLRPLGADTAGSQFLDPDGNFPNHIPNPEEPEAIESVTKAARSRNDR